MNALELIVHALFGVDSERALPVFFLVSARTLPLAFAAPWLGYEGTLFLARLAVGMTLSIVMTPLALTAAPELPSAWLALAFVAMREVLVGVVFAIATSIPLFALGWAGELIDRWRGSSVESAPHESSPPLGTLHASAALVAFVLVGGHRLALGAFGETLIAHPPGAGASAATLGSFAWGAARLVMDALELALAFAAPAAIAFVLLELALALSARVAPELRPFFWGMPLRAGLGVALALLGLSAILPRLSPLFTDSIRAASDLVRALGG